MVKRIGKAASLTGICLIGGLFVGGCAMDRAPLRVDVASVSINGQPVHLVLDTGASSTMIYSTTADRVGLKFASPRPNSDAGKFEVDTGMSEPATVTVVGDTFTTRLPVFVPGSKTPREDGVIGWPEIRDDILVFDPDQRVVNAAPDNPIQPAGWSKFNVLRHDTLCSKHPFTTAGLASSWWTQARRKAFS